MFHGISLNSVLLLLLVNFVTGLRLELIYIYFPHRNYQVKPHSSPWFSAACAAAVFHRNHFGQASNRCKRVFETTKLSYATKTKESITFEKLSSHDFWRIANSVLDKGKSAIPPLFNGSEVLSSISDKVKLFP